MCRTSPSQLNSHTRSHTRPHTSLHTWAPLTPSANRASKKPASHHPFSSNTRARPRVTAARIINSQRLHHHLAESCLTPSHVASQPPRPGPAMEAPGDFRDLVCLPASHWPSPRLADNPPTPPLQPLQLAPAAVMVCTPCYGNISHSLSLSLTSLTLSSLSHPHPYSRSNSSSSSHPSPICPPSPPRQYLPSPAPSQFASCRPKAASKATLQHMPHMCLFLV